jgi:hypothetical protein
MMKKAIALERRRLSALLYACLLAVLIALSTTQVRTVVAADGQYVFYGYAPSTIVNYTEVEDGSIIPNFTRFPASLDIVGINDTTQVEVYDLTSMGLLASKTIDRMELWTVQLGSRETGETVPQAEEAYVKVVSDKLVAVHLGGGPGRPFQGGGGGGLVVYGSFVFYPSTDGGFAGEEFIFMATETTWKPDMYFGEHDVYHIFSVCFNGQDPSRRHI